MPFWADFYQFFTRAFQHDSLSKKRAERAIDSVGVTQPDAIPDIRSENWWGGGNRGQIRLRDSNDFIDLSSVTNRKSRYKEYERLRGVAEIEAALDILADESCVAGETPVATPFGYIPIKELADTKKPDEKFLVYCWNFETNDYTLGWAYNPRKVKTAPTVEILINNGTSLVLTPDHRILKRDGKWIEAGNLKTGDDLMPFYRLSPIRTPNSPKTNQFPRIFTFSDGWKHERQFIDDWSLGEKADRDPRSKKLLKILSEGVLISQAEKMMKLTKISAEGIMNRAGFTYKELIGLRNRYPDRRKVLGVIKNKEVDVYDLSVLTHENFASDGCILHNCQKGDNGHTFEIVTKNEAVKKELELLFHRVLGVDRKIWNWAKNLYCMGDWFGEIVVDTLNPKDGILKISPLPADSIYRIETTKGKLLEFQQSQEGPDYQSLARVDVTQASDSEIAQATALRFTPEQIVHMRIGDDRKMFYPYGVSIIEPARGPAHNLRLLEDSMVVYRLCLVGDTRIRTTNGYKYIKDIKVGDRVWAVDQEGGQLPAEVTNFYANGKQKVYKVKSKHIEITGTATHPLMVNRDGIIQLVDIQDIIPKKDKLLNITNDQDVLVKIPKCFKGEYAVLSKNQKEKVKYIETSRKHYHFAKDNCKLLRENTVGFCEPQGLNADELISCNKDDIYQEIINLPKFVDEEFARLFGFLIGQGSLRKGQICFSASPDQALNNYYSSLLNKFFGRVKFCPDNRTRKTRGLGNYSVRSMNAVKVFLEMGYIPECNNKRIPGWVFSASKAIRRAFVEGISDADGYERYTKSGTWFSTIELCDKELIEDIKELWHSIGLCSGKITHRYRKGGHEIVPGRRMKDSESFNVTISDCELPKYENVWSVECVGEEDVYDFTVDRDEHNFVANGTSSFNSRAPERRVFYIDVGGLPPNKAEAFIERLKDQLRKKKLYTNRSGQPGGASSVEERWHAPAADEDFWLPIRPNGNTRIETLPGACISLDTEIPLLDGRDLTLRQMIKEFDSGKQLWVYSCDPKTGEVKPGLVSWAGVTRKNTKVVKVTFDNGKSITCTPDHKFPVQVKGKTEAKDLQPGDSVFPFETKFKNIQPDKLCYDNLKNLHQKGEHYNRKVISVEFLEETMDTGTLTIDADHIIHDYHTFAIKDICYIYNSNLGEVDDALYFRNKLLIALHLPKNYMSQEDANLTTKTLSSQNVPFARYVERLQMSLADGLLTIAERHLILRGFPEEMWSDLDIQMTPPSAWRESSLMEIMQSRYQNATTVSQGPTPLMSRYDALVDILKYQPDVARDMTSRAKMQAIEDAKIQLMGQNPDLAGVGQPGQDDQEIGSEAGGPNPMLGGDQQPPPPPEANPPQGDQKDEPAQGPAGAKPKNEGKPLPEPSDEEIRKYDLAIRDFSKEKDDEEVDNIEVV